MAISHRHPLLRFVALAIALLLTEWLVVQSQAFQLRPDPLSLGVTVDVVMVLPLLYYWFMIRTGRWSGTSLVVFFGASLGLAKWLLPSENQAYVDSIAQTLPLLELAVLGYMVWHGRAVIRAYQIHRQRNPDFIVNLQQSLTDVTGNGRLSQIITSEATVFRYGLFGWWGHPKIGPKQRLFTSHRTSAQVAFLVAAGIIGAVETTALHFLVARWSVVGAWFLTAVSLYSLLFIIAETVVTVQQPTLLDGQTLSLRFGLRWRITVPLANISCIERISETPHRHATLLVGPLLVQPNVLLTLREPVMAKGMYGITRTVRQVAVLVDEPNAFVAVAG